MSRTGFVVASEFWQSGGMTGTERDKVFQRIAKEMKLQVSAGARPATANVATLTALSSFPAWHAP